MGKDVYASQAADTLLLRYAQYAQQILSQIMIEHSANALPLISSSTPNHLNVKYAHHILKIHKMVLNVYVFKVMSF